MKTGIQDPHLRQLVKENPAKREITFRRCRKDQNQFWGTAEQALAIAEIKVSPLSQTVIMTQHLKPWRKPYENSQLRPGKGDNA